MLPLIPLLIGLVPDIIKLFGSSDDAAVAQKVVGVAQGVLGTIDPTMAQATLQDPAKATELKLAFAQLLAQQEKAKDDAKQAQLVALLGDLTGARNHDLEVRRMAGGRNIRADLMLGMVTVGLVTCIVAVVFGKIDAMAFGLVSSIAGVLAGCFKDAFGFEYGSSRGSEAKTQIIADMGKTMVQAPPVPLALPAPADPVATTEVTVNSPLPQGAQS